MREQGLWQGGPRPSRRRVLSGMGAALAAVVGGCAAGRRRPRDLETIAYGETKSGHIDKEDGTEPEHDGLAEPAEFEGETGDVVRLSIDREDGDGYLVLVAPDGTVLDDNRWSREYIETALGTTGTHTVWAGIGEEGATGAYTLTLERVDRVEPDARDLRTIEYGETKAGYLHPSDRQDGSGDIGEPVTFDGQEGDPIRVTVSSKAFEPGFDVIGPRGDSIYLSGRERVLSSSGTHTILVKSPGQQAFGPYSLSVIRRGTPGESGERTMAYGETISGYVSRAEMDDGGSSGETPGERVTFEGSAGDVVRIDARSNAKVPSITLMGPEGREIAPDGFARGFSGGFQTGLTRNGTHTIRVTAVPVGHYTLSLEKTGEFQPGARDVRTIAAGEVKESRIDPEDGRDPIHGGIAEPIAFDGRAGELAVIVMRADTFQEYLVVVTDDGTLVAGGDLRRDGPIQTRLPHDGTYTLWAGSASGEATGEYVLSVAAP